MKTMKTRILTAPKRALFYEAIPSAADAPLSAVGAVRCVLCPHRCKIFPGRTGLCGVRKNVGGMLTALTYERLSSLALDPIEKKPLRRFHPGSRILSAGSVGCNLKCPFCQNHAISQCSPEQAEMFFMDSRTLVQKALDLRTQDNIGIAFTYNEPTVWYEYVFETAKLAKESGLCTALVTNGYISPEPLRLLLPFVDAMNIDLKSWNADFYRDTLRGGLEEVKATIRAACEKCHVEVTTLVIPGVNDSPEEIAQIAAFLASISPQIPLHLSRFFPRHEWRDRTPTPPQTVFDLADVARRTLEFVYVGNV